MKTILLIEDSTDIRENTSEILELANYKVLTAENGKIGVELAKSSHPDIIICDIMMPELDGYGVLNILSRNPETASIPFIFLSAKSEAADQRKGMNLGADDYVTKPFKASDLIEVVQSRLLRTERFKTEEKSGVDKLNDFYNEARAYGDLKNLSNDRKIKSFNKKEEIFRQDDYANYLYFILKGKVKSVRTDSYGKTIVNGIYGPDTFIGYTALLDDGEYHETTIAMSDTDVAVIPKSDFVELIKSNRDVAMNFIKLLAGNVQEREKKILQLAYAPVRERVASALLSLKEKATLDGNPDEIKISRDDLASVVGTAKESLIRMLSELKKDGLIETDGLIIKVLDEPGLKKISCE